jgi:PAS domain S-box-containing protein
VKTSVDCRALVEASGDAIIASDAEGRIVLWNQAAQRIFGHTEAEALGQPLDMIIPERMRKRHGDGYEKSMRTGETKYGHSLLKVPALHKDGHQISIAFSVAMLFDAQHKVSSIVAIVRDETARFTEERALRKRLADLEARQSAAP